jgi:uncharacterized protein (DUF1778 family)
MNTARENKQDRINLRLEKKVKDILERAAGFEGKTVSSFIINSALEQAEKTIQDYETMTLNAEYSKTFLEALSAPVNFNSRLKEAMEEHEERVLSK